MTRKLDPEVKALRAAARAIEDLTLDAQFRCLAYLVARTSNAGATPLSDRLYVLAQEAARDAA